MNKPIVAALPAWKNRRLNPFQDQLHRALEPLGYRAEEFEKAIRHLSRVAIVHLHWPDGAVLHPSRFKTVLRLVLFFTLLGMYRLRRIPVVWTAHNTRSHDRHHPRLEALLWRFLYPRLSAIVCLKPVSEQPELTGNPALRHKTFVHIPHGGFGDYYRARATTGPERKDPEQEGKRASPARSFLIFGQIRPYKNVPETIRAFGRFSDPKAALLIAGRCLDVALEAEIMIEVSKDPRVTFENRFVEDEQVAELMESVDALVSTVDVKNNSGVLHLAASFNLPVVFADKNPNWTQPETIPVPPDWSTVAAAHARLYESLRNQ